MQRRFLLLSLALLATLAPLACASGGSQDGTPAGDDAGVGDDVVMADGAEASADGADAEGGGTGTSAQKACADNATSYCAQLQKCALFLLQTQYGDSLTCTTRNAISCMDALQANGTGWTGDALEACVKARSALDCDTFLHGKPAPNACRVTGSITTSSSCRYSAQCGSGYCRYASGALCGNCVTLGATGAPCTSSSDCDGNLMCAGAGTCQPPSGVSAACDNSHPCQQGLACIAGTCAQPAATFGAPCAAKNNSADCDYYQQLYCDGTAMVCKSYITPHDGQPCGGATPTVCYGDGTCFGGSCVAPVQDGAPCNGDAGENCQAPSTCQNGLCQLYSATQCK